MKISKVIENNNVSSEELFSSERFDSFDNSDWDQLFAGGEDHIFKNGEYILRIDSINNNLYKVKSGVAKVLIPTKSGEKEVATIDHSNLVFFFYNFFFFFYYLLFIFFYFLHFLFFIFFYFLFFYFYFRFSFW